MWDDFPAETRTKMFEQAAEELLVKHVAHPDEIAEAYLFAMKWVFFCLYISSQGADL